MSLPFLFHGICLSRSARPLQASYAFPFVLCVRDSALQPFAINPANYFIVGSISLDWSKQPHDKVHTVFLEAKEPISGAYNSKPMRISKQMTLHLMQSNWFWCWGFFRWEKFREWNETMHRICISLGLTIFKMCIFHCNNRSKCGNGMQSSRRMLWICMNLSLWLISDSPKMFS